MADDGGGDERSSKSKTERERERREDSIILILVSSIDGVVAKDKECFSNLNLNLNIASPPFLAAVHR